MRRVDGLAVTVRRCVGLCVCGILGCALLMTNAHATTHTDTLAVYREKVRAPLGEIEAALRAIPQITAIGLRYPVAPTAPRTALSRLRPLISRIVKETKTISGLAPPTSEAHAQTQLVRSSGALVASLHAVVRRLERGYLSSVAGLESLGSLSRTGAAVAGLERGLGTSR